MKIKIGQYFVCKRQDGRTRVYQTIKSLSCHTILLEITDNKKVFANREKFLKGCKVRFVTETKAKEIAEKLRKERM